MAYTNEVANRGYKKVIQFDKKSRFGGKLFMGTQPSYNFKNALEQTLASDKFANRIGALETIKESIESGRMNVPGGDSFGLFGSGDNIGDNSLLTNIVVLATLFPSLSSHN